jgi:hypothetical protein
VPNIADFISVFNKRESHEGAHVAQIGRHHKTKCVLQISAGTAYSLWRCGSETQHSTDINRQPCKTVASNSFLFLSICWHYETLYNSHTETHSGVLFHTYAITNLHLDGKHLHNTKILQIKHSLYLVTLRWSVVETILDTLFPACHIFLYISLRTINIIYFSQQYNTVYVKPLIVYQF